MVEGLLEIWSYTDGLHSSWVMSKQTNVVKVWVFLNLIWAFDTILDHAMYHDKTSKLCLRPAFKKQIFKTMYGNGMLGLLAIW